MPTISKSIAPVCPTSIRYILIKLKESHTRAEPKQLQKMQTEAKQRERKGKINNNKFDVEYFQRFRDFYSLEMAFGIVVFRCVTGPRATGDGFRSWIGSIAANLFVFSLWMTQAIQNYAFTARRPANHPSNPWRSCLFNFDLKWPSSALTDYTSLLLITTIRIVTIRRYGSQDKDTTCIPANKTKEKN